MKDHVLPASPLLRPARFAEIGFVHEALCAAADEAVGEVPDFAEQEKRRFAPAYLHALSDADPNTVLIALSPQGERAGIIVSGPENGAVILYWCYLLPQYRKGALAMRCLSAYVKLWQGKRAHKLIAYTRASNRATRLMMQRVGYREVAVLEKHFFGLDFVLCDYMLDKREEGHDPFVTAGLAKRLALRLRAVSGGR